MKTLKSIINAVLILLMAIYGLAMLALLILPFVDVTNLFPGAEVHYLSGWGYWLVSELQFAFYLALLCLLRKELKDFTWKAFWTEDFSLFLKKAALLTFVPSALNIFLQLGTTNHLVVDFSTSVWLLLVSLACDAVRLRKELKDFTWKAFWTEDFSLFLKKAALLTFVPSALNIFLQLGTTNHLVVDFSTSVWLLLVSLACDAVRLRKGQTAVK